LDPSVEDASYRLNDGPWYEIKDYPPRVESPQFLIELSADKLRAGENQLRIRASTGSGKNPQIVSRKFIYDPSPIALPVAADWSQENLDVGEGAWETIVGDHSRRVRPKPGTEDYDRILLVTGAFKGGRRIKTDFIYRYHIHDRHGRSKLFGFGVLPQWGGRPDNNGHELSRGWNFSIAWFYSRYKAVGAEFSYKFADQEAKWVDSFHNLDLKRDHQYFLEADIRPVVDREGNHVCYQLRMRWSDKADPASEVWLELSDKEGCPFPEKEYAVALIAHRCQVEFGPVTVEPLAAVTVTA
jgi:hypothetical protein